MSEYNLPIAVNNSLELPPDVLSKIVSSEKMSSMIQDKYESVLKPDINDIVDSKNNLLESSLNNKIEEKGVSRENIVRTLGYSLVVSDKEPEIKEEFGVPIIWLDTRDPDNWVPGSVVIDDTSKTLVIPFDKGVEYYKNGEIISNGTYSLTPEESPYEVVVLAVPKSGYKISGKNRWSEFITPGYRTYFYDSLKTGSFVDGRSSGGVTYKNIRNPENVAISTNGLKAFVWARGSSGRIPLSDQSYVGIKTSVDYSINSGQISLSNSVESSTYGGNQSCTVRLSVNSLSLSIYPTAKSIVKEELDIPSTGTLVLETTRSLTKAYINENLAATVYHSDEITSIGKFVDFGITGGNEAKPNFASNLKVELK